MHIQRSLSTFFIFFLLSSRILLLIMFKYALIASVGIASAFAAATPAVDLKSVLQYSKNKWSPDTRIFFPGDPNVSNGTYAKGSYTNGTSTNDITPRWNAYFAPSYVASIRLGSEVDVQKVVSQPVPSVQSRH